MSHYSCSAWHSVKMNQQLIILAQIHQREEHWAITDAVTKTQKPQVRHQDCVGEEKLLSSVTSSVLSSLFTHIKVQLSYGTPDWWRLWHSRASEDSCSEGTTAADLHITEHVVFHQVERVAVIKLQWGVVIDSDLVVVRETMMSRMKEEPQVGT